MMSRELVALCARTTRGSHAGNAAAANAAPAPATNWRRESSLYSWQPKSSMWLMGSSSVPLELGRRDRERERLPDAGRVRRRGAQVRHELLPRALLHLAAEHPPADLVDDRVRGAEPRQRGDVDAELGAGVVGE